jgi:hypothetical protein
VGRVLPLELCAATRPAGQTHARHTRPAHAATLTHQP